MRIRSIFGVVLVGLLAPSIASAQNVRKRVPKIVVLDFPVEKSFDANTNATLSEFYASDLRKEGFTVITSGDVAAALGVEKQRELTGCSDSGCIAEIGNALGSDYLARGTVAVLQQTTALTLSLQDARGVEINRVSVRIADKSPDALLAKLDELVPQLVQPLRDSGKLAVATAPAPNLAPTTGAPPAPTAVVAATSAAPAASSPDHLPSYVLFGVGGAGIVAGIVGAILYSSDLGPLQNAASGTTPGLTSAQGSALRAHVQRDEVLATAGLAAGAVAAGVGLVLYLLAPSAPVATVAGPNGSAALALRF